MSKISNFKSVINSSLDYLVSRNGDYNGYWVWGFVISKGKTVSLDIVSPQSLTVELQFLQTLTRNIVSKQIKKHFLCEYPIKGITLHFSTENDGKIISYPNKRVVYKTYVRLEIFLKEKCYSSEKVIYVGYHNEKFESQRAI